MHLLDLPYYGVPCARLNLAGVLNNRGNLIGTELRVDKLGFSSFVYPKPPIPEISDISPQPNAKGVCLVPDDEVSMGGVTGTTPSCEIPTYLGLGI